MLELKADWLTGAGMLELKADWLVVQAHYGLT